MLWRGEFPAFDKNRNQAVQRVACYYTNWAGQKYAGGLRQQSHLRRTFIFCIVLSNWGKEMIQICLILGERDRVENTASQLVSIKSPLPSNGCWLHYLARGVHTTIYGIQIYRVILNYCRGFRFSNRKKKIKLLKEYEIATRNVLWYVESVMQTAKQLQQARLSLHVRCPNYRARKPRQ
jgi:hypothetical protein